MSGCMLCEPSKTHRKQVLPSIAFLQLCDGLVLRVCPATQLLKDASFLCLPVPLLALLQHSIELLLSLFSCFFNGRDEVLFVGMSEVSRDVCVLESL